MTADVVPLPPPMPGRRDLAKTFCQCLGLAALVLAMNYGDLLGGGADVRMHVPFALVGICLAQLADVFVVALLLFAILLPLKRTRFYPVVRLLLVILVPPYVLFRLQELSPLLQTDGLLLVFSIVWGVLLILVYLRFKRWYRKLLQFGDAVGVFLFIFAVASLAQIAWVMLWRPGPYAHPPSWAGASQPPRRHPLVVWVVFDELSFDQTFGHRARDLDLPNFDRLRSQSTLYTQATPIGRQTVKIIPSLLLGTVLDDVHFNFDNSVKLHYVGRHGWHPFDPQATLFADAQRKGWRTAAVGWYNPYCTMYAGTVDDCYAMNLDRIDGDMAQNDGFWRNTYSPLAEMVREIKSPERADRDTCTYDVRQRLKTFLDLQAHTQALLRRDQTDFVFLHLPVPHSPNIWSRDTGDYTTFCDSSYIDNLALADRVLGGVLSQLQASPRWKDTTLIVQGDHSWRWYLWNHMPAWTSQDDAVTRGTAFDPRPAVLIHRAGQTAPETVDAPWSILNVHSVMERVLQGP